MFHAAKTGESGMTLAGAILSADTTADELRRIFDEELDTAALTIRRKQKIYSSVRQLSELIGGEYGDRVIYELLQNAHDAHPHHQPGKIAVRVVVESDSSGVLYVANGGAGFSIDNVQAVRNIATSTKEIGEGIGNKGVGFRSIEALTSDAHIYSRRGAAPVERFDGFCFRFASPDEIKRRATELGFGPEAAAVAAAMPRYLAAVPVADQSEVIVNFAKQGFATVVALPLVTAEAVRLAVSQVQELLTRDAPVLLFLERVRTLDVEIEGVGVTRRRRTLTREHARTFTAPEGLDNCTIESVTMGPERRAWLLVRRIVAANRVIDAVKRSLPQERGLKRWLDWEGDAVVSLAVPIEGAGLIASRLYNFLPMGPESAAPLLCHLDAPFYTSIDRRRAKLDLPLNVELFNAAGEAAAAAALALARHHPEISARVVVDLIAWQPSQLPRLRAAFAAVGSEWASAAVWPTIDRRWASLKSLKTWPDGKYKVFTPLRAANWGDASILLPTLDPTRTTAVKALAKAAFIQIEPTARELAPWAEMIASQLSRTGDAPARIWSPFYAELHEAFGRATDGLKLLLGRSILLERGEDLIQAGPEVYVRQDSPRRGKSEGAPTPPRDVARMLNVLSERVPVRPEVFVSFERANLWKRYDATEILGRLDNLFGDKPAPARRRAALAWAFEVWHFDTAATRKVLPRARLHVPTRSGWTPASQSTFSETWTSIGRQLDAYLAEAGQLDPHCIESAGNLLTPYEDWPEMVPSLKSEWTKFLADAGVVDGLIPMAAPLPEGPYRGDEWNWRLNSSSGPGLDKGWSGNKEFSNTRHPYTSYSRQGEAWRAPGQTVVHQLSADARRRFAILLLQLLERSGSQFLSFNLGRFEREDRHQDIHAVRTPLRTFLMAQPWAPVTATGAEEFQRLRDTWLMGDRRSDPRFVPHLLDEVAEHIPTAGKALEILSQGPFGLRIWKDPTTAPARLTALAHVADGLEQSYRAPFRRHYDQAWRDALSQSGWATPTELAVERPTGYSTLTTDQSRPKVYVRSERDRDLTRLLIETGAGVLVGSGEVSSAEIISRLNGGECFRAAPVEDGDIKLVVDNVVFEPRLSDALLTDVVPWLREAVLLAHELKAQDLEKVITEAMIDEKLAIIRVRQCDSIALCPTEGPSRALSRYVYRDDTRPTLLISGAFDAQQIADLAAQLAGLIHTNLRSLEPALLRLAPRLVEGVSLADLAPPDAEDYAVAMQVDLVIIQDLLADRRADHGRPIDLIAPFLMYHVGLDATLTVLVQLRDRPRREWVQTLAPVLPNAEALLERLRHSEDLALIRREQGLDYARFNHALMALGRPRLSSLTELKRQFEVWKLELSPSFMDRIRRSMKPRLTEPGALASYAGYRKLDFLTFDERREDTHETLQREDVRKRAEQLLSALLGADPGGSLPERETLRAGNRRIVAMFAKDAARILLALPDTTLHPAWETGPHEVAAAADRSGALDFALLEPGEAIATLARAGLWPEGVEQTLDLEVLGLKPEDLDAKERARLAAAKEEVVRRNSITFGGNSYDTTAGDFAVRFAGVANTLFGTSDWRARTRLRPVPLKAMPESLDAEPRGGGGRGGAKRNIQRLPESIRHAMGLGGELLAFQYLKLRHRERFSDSCWVSENRASLFPEAGDPTHGFDFRVPTTETEWVYEVKATTGEATEFELTDNEYRVAAQAAAERGRRYRILLVQYVFDLDRCRVLELPNPAGQGRTNFKIVGRSSVRMAFELA